MSSVKKAAQSVIHKVLPRATLRKYLFEFKSPLSYKNVVSTYESAYNYGLGPTLFGEDIGPAQLMTLKRVLETHRKRSGSVTKIGAQIESNLVERAAELGDNTAIALLCGSTLMDSVTQADSTGTSSRQPSAQDLAHANKLLRQLMDLKFPLAFKISGDVAYKMGRLTQARQFYQLAVDNGIALSMANATSLETECYRSIGLISFMNKDLETAKVAFEKAVQLSPGSKSVMDCHFYLAQILAYHPHAVRYHLERAAAQGLKEAFAPLAFVLMKMDSSPHNESVADRQHLALEWFRLGSSINDFNCLVGLFDYCTKLGSNSEALACLDKIRASTDPRKEAVLSKRQDSIKSLESDANRSGRWD